MTITSERINGSVFFEKYGVKFYKNRYGTVMVDSHFHKKPEEELYKIIPTALGVNYNTRTIGNIEITSAWKDIHTKRIQINGFIIKPDLLMWGYFPSPGGKDAGWFFEVKNGDITSNDLIQILLGNNLLKQQNKPFNNEEIIFSDGSSCDGFKECFYAVICGCISEKKLKILNNFRIPVILHKDYINTNEKGCDKWM